MGYTSSSSFRSPKKEEQQVPETITSIHSNYNNSCSDEDFNILDELEEVMNIEEEQKLLPQKACWDFMEWEEFSSTVEEKDKVIVENKNECTFEEQKIIKRENNDGFWEMEDEKIMALNLNLNYQDVLDAWSDRGSLWADDSSLSYSTDNGFYVSTHYSSSILHFHIYRN